MPVNVASLDVMIFSKTRGSIRPSPAVANANPYAVFPLIRAFAEAVVLVFYVNDHPQYVRTLIVPERELPKGGPKRKTIKALISYASEHAPGMEAVYRELSEATHFGSTAMWIAHKSEGRRGGASHLLVERAPLAKRRRGFDRLCDGIRDRRRDGCCAARVHAAACPSPFAKPSSSHLPSLGLNAPTSTRVCQKCADFPQALKARRSVVSVEVWMSMPLIFRPPVRRLPTRAGTPPTRVPPATAGTPPAPARSARYPARGRCCRPSPQKLLPARIPHHKAVWWRLAVGRTARSSVPSHAARIFV